MLLSCPTEKSRGTHLTDIGILRAGPRRGGSAGSTDPYEVTAPHLPVSSRPLREPPEHVTTDYVSSCYRMEGCSSASLPLTPSPQLAKILTFEN